jgi:hypothetical protein
METNNRDQKSSGASFEKIEKLIFEGEAPPHIKIAAAKGALPFSPLSLLHLRVFLMKDNDKSVQSEASKGIQSIPEDSLLKMLNNRKCHSTVLAFYAAQAGEKNIYLESIVQNPSVPDDVLIAIAEKAPAEILELIMMNEQRLISSPSILEAMERNTLLQEHLKSKMIELREKFLSGEMKTETVESDAEEELELEEPKPAEGEDLDPSAGELLEEEASTIDIDESFGESYIIEGDELESGPEEIKDTYRKILVMSMPDKILTALRGAKSERAVLIRDSNRIISLTVLKNPKISEQEIESFSAMKHLDDEVLREIGRTREWTKHYSICFNLVRNPKSPPAISTTLMHRMTNADLKQLQIDKNVPELIRQMARKTLRMRTQKAITIRKK